MFVSLRFGESLAEALELKKGLEERGLKVFICDQNAGANLHLTISNALNG